MADNPTEEAPSAAPAVEAPAPVEVPVVEAISPAATAEIQGEAEPGDRTVERPPADAEEQPVEVGEEGEKPMDEGQDGQGSERISKGPVTAEQRKRLKLEKVKKMLDTEKAAMKEAMKAAQAAQAAEAASLAKSKKLRHEEEGSHESYQSQTSEGEGESGDEFEDLKAILNEFDNIEPPEPADSEDEDEESVTSEDTPRPRVGTSLKGEFLREFESLPSISDISLDSETASELEAEPEPVVQKSTADEPDTGHFVDGDGEEGEGESESESGADSGTAPGTAAGGEEESESESSLMDDLPDEPEGHEKHVIIKEEEEDTMAMFAVAVEADTVIKPEVVIPVEEPFWYRLTRDFLDNLIDTVVNNAELFAYKEHKLDKFKMLVALIHEVEHHNAEKNLNIIVNNIVCDYFRRNGKNMNFAALPPEDAANERIRFLNALNLTDSLMERVKLMKINYGTSTHKAMMELNSLTVLSYNEEQRLEALMRKTLIRRDMDRLKRAVDNDLRRMQDLRNQVSEKRYELNLNLHNLAFVDEKVMRFERVTETLTISQMLCANESIIQLSKQLEEKSKDVAVMQSNYKKSMIEETCIREKRDMISYSLSKAKLNFEDRFERRNQLRKELTRLQLEHAELKAQRVRLEAKGGLLFKVSLMYDYDKCLEDVLEKREKVKNLKVVAADLTKRIQHIENETRHSSRHFR